jgi:hypothetical protein
LKTSIDEAKLKLDLGNLSAIRGKIVGAIVHGTSEGEISDELVHEYRSLKAEVLLQLTGTKTVPTITDPALRSELKDFLKDGDEFITRLKRAGVDKKLIKGFEDLFEPEFGLQREDEVAEEVFLSWFSQYDYVRRMLDTATIVIKNIDFPEKLHALINEVRQCVIFQNYLAAGIILRTIAEVAVDDILEKNYDLQTNQDLSGKMDFLEHKSRFSIPAGVLDSYRRDLNGFVHGNEIMDRDKIYFYLETVLNQVQKMYEESK